MSGVWVWLPLAGPIRISTIVAALVIFGVVGIWRRRPLVGLVAMMAWISAFEILYNAAGVVVLHTPLGAFAWEVAALLGWVVAADLLGIRPPWWALVPFLLLSVIWIVTGFHSNLPARSFSLRDEVLNEATKSALAAAYLIASLQSPTLRSQRPLSRLPATKEASLLPRTI
ncbi:MAG TPA: hypothetical protein VNU19_09095 [Candidatus Acidoferrum sp.]|nr:hypothetical protein [Candidatus Acidoferrum sp.]